MVTNKQIAQAFRNARSILPRGPMAMSARWSVYICDCIHDANRYTVTGIAAGKAVSIINERIGDRFSLQDWLVSQGVPENEITVGRLQAHRYQWLGQLIKEFSK